MSSEQSHRIKALNATNYSTWSDEMKALLRSKGLWRLVVGTEARPSDAAAQPAWDARS
ncbi:hypothetical protein BU15DRAFT_51317, partial [Melanogaster broomeanus]